MRNFIISTESASDLTNNLTNKYNLEIMPMRYFINEKEYISKEINENIEELANAMKNGAITKTSQPNEFEIEAYLINLLKQKKDIIHFSFSSSMSGTCQNFKNVANKLNRRNTNKIYVIDTLCQSSGVGLLISILCEKIESENLSIKETVEYAEILKNNINHVFIVDSLTYLARGGRISTKQAIFGNLINIKPVLFLDENGKIVLAQKTLGRKKSLSVLMNKFSKLYNKESDIVFIGYSDCLDEANKVKEELLKSFPNLKIQLIPFGPIILSHCGTKTLALFFTGEKRTY